MLVDRGDVLLNSVAFGPDREPLLALSGWNATWPAWAPTLGIVSRVRRCIAYDTRGSAGSPCSPDAITLDALVADVFAVLDAHGVSRCTLAAESLGGFVALNAVLADPSRFTDLVVVAATPVVTPASSAARVASARADYSSTIRAFVEQCLSEPDGVGLRPWAQSLFAGADPECAVRLLECGHGVAPDLSAITVPTTVIHGSDDQVIPVAAGRMIAATVPGAAYVELADTGHAPTVTRPQDIADVLGR